MDPRELLIFIRRWRISIVLWSSLTFLAVAVLVFTRPPVYTASSTVLVDRTQAPITAPDRFFSPPAADEAQNTQINIIRSRPVIEAVVDQLKLVFVADAGQSNGIGSTAKERLRTWLRGVGLLSERLSPREAWVERLSRDLKVRPVVDSNILNIGFEFTDPSMTQRVVNAVTDEYIARRLRINASKGASEFYQAKLEETERGLQSRRNQLDLFKRENSVTAISESRIGLVEEGRLLRARLAATQAELRERLTRYREGHPSVILLRQEIASIEADLRRGRSELQRLETNEAKIRDMQVLIETLETTFVNYQTKLEEARVRESATQGLINVRVVGYATLPGRPSNSRLALLMTGVFGALFMGLFVAALRQYFDRHIRSEDQVEKILALPVYGSVGKYRP